MSGVRATVVCMALVFAACGGGGSRAANCSEYAADLRSKTADMTSDEVSRYIDDTADRVAHLIQADRQDGQICADAVLEALFTSGINDLFGGVDE